MSSRGIKTNVETPLGRGRTETFSKTFTLQEILAVQQKIEGIKATELNPNSYKIQIDIPLLPQDGTPEYYLSPEDIFILKILYIISSIKNADSSSTSLITLLRENFQFSNDDNVEALANLIQELLQNKQITLQFSEREARWDWDLGHWYTEDGNKINVNDLTQQLFGQSLAITKTANTRVETDYDPFTHERDTTHFYRYKYSIAPLPLAT